MPVTEIACIHCNHVFSITSLGEVIGHSLNDGDFDAQAYYDGLIAANYTPVQALSETQKYFPGFNEAASDFNKGSIAVWCRECTQKQYVQFRRVVDRDDFNKP